MSVAGLRPSSVLCLFGGAGGQMGRLGHGLQASKLPQGFVKDKMAMAGGAGGLLCDEDLSQTCTESREDKTL